ncbi:MAG: AI-2E family transporter [Bacteroidales bacterium]|nr:AI-2E family transporter [Bacteroidales bacterium]
MKNNTPILGIVIDIAIKLGILLLVLAWCFRIISPFINIVFWALIIAVTLYPLFDRLSHQMKGSKKAAAVIITVVSLAVIFVPGILFTDSLVDGIRTFNKGFDREDLVIPPPDAQVKDWPLVGDKLYQLWEQAARDPESLGNTYSKQIKTAAGWLLDALMDTGMTLLQFILSIIISGIFLAIADSGGDMIRRLFRRLVNEQGDEYFRMSALTVRNVSKGVIGVAFIQSLLAGLAFLLAGVPYAGLWALLCLILCIIQLGPALVIIPVIVYIFSIMDTWAAVLWAIVLVLVMLSDNILKPLLMGKGAPVPTLVIFLGSLGGFIASGFMGLFLGAIVLSLGYKLVLAWVKEGEEYPNSLS